MDELNDLRELVLLLEKNTNSKKKKLHIRLKKEMDNLVSKYEYMYDKYIIKNKSVNNIKDEKEKQIKIVQNSINMFFPYILAYNVAQIS